MGSVQAANLQPEFCSNIQGLSLANIQVCVHPKKWKTTELSIFILPHLFIIIKETFIFQVPTTCQDLWGIWHAFTWNFQLHSQLENLESKKHGVLVKIPKKYQILRGTWKCQIFGGKNHVRIFEIVKSFSKYLNIWISVAALVLYLFLASPLTLRFYVNGP